MDINKYICTKFKVEHSDSLPFITGRQTTRKDLYDLLAEIGYTYGAEIGVQLGLNAEMMLQSIPKLKLICVDPWSAILRNSKLRQNSRCHQAMRRLSKYNAEIRRMTSMDAVRDFPDNSLDFVYIDGSHYFDNVMCDIIEWSKKVKPGGIVSGDDYYNFHNGGVVHAVNAYTTAHNINWYLTTDLRFLWVK